MFAFLCKCCSCLLRIRFFRVGRMRFLWVFFFVVRKTFSPIQNSVKVRCRQIIALVRNTRFFFFRSHCFRTSTLLKKCFKEFIEPTFNTPMQKNEKYHSIFTQIFCQRNVFRFSLVLFPFQFSKQIYNGSAYLFLWLFFFAFFSSLFTFDICETMDFEMKFRDKKNVWY